MFSLNGNNNTCGNTLKDVLLSGNHPKKNIKVKGNILKVEYKKKFFSAIFASDQNGLIGNGDELPWYIPNDFKHFKELTIGKPVVMGRKTFESIGKPLPKRLNIVITRDKDFKFDGVMVFNSLEDFYSYADEFLNEETVIIGGANLIEQMFDKIDTFYVTHIHNKFEGDCFINIDYTKLKSIDLEYNCPDTQNNFGYTFNTYIKR